MEKRYDVVIVGGGILGVSIAYWLSLISEGAVIALIEKESAVALHTSRRNTGVIHRPFYVNPQKKKKFAISAQISYGLWNTYAKEQALPWSPVGTLEVATEESHRAVLKQYKEFSLANGMEESEVRLLDPQEVKAIEPNIDCLGALLCTTDTAVDYGAFTISLHEDAKARGVQFIMGNSVTAIADDHEGLKISMGKEGSTLCARYLINCSGGNAIDLAHAMGVANEYTDLHFRGEYWEVDPAHATLASRNIYAVPRQREFPFLDPHWIVRHGGQVCIGPNAVPVASPYWYGRGPGTPAMVLSKFFERPVRNKLSLFTNPDFLKLVYGEWRSSLFKSAMVQSIQRFLPSIRPEMLARRGESGIRSSVIDRKGNFVAEALELYGPHSFHVLNYNSPGATGAPAFAAYVTNRLMSEGKLDHLHVRKIPAPGIWNFDRVITAFREAGLPI